MYKNGPHAERVKALHFSIAIFTLLKLRLAAATHNFNGVKIIYICTICSDLKNGGQLFSNLAGWCHILSLTYLKYGT